MGGVAVGEQTHRATERVFEYEPLEPVSVKGKAEPPGAVAGEGGPFPLRYRHHPPVHDAVGRPRVGEAAADRDVRAGGAAALGAAGHDRGRARGGQEPRLVAELFAYLGTKPELTRWRQGRCLPYGEGITFWALGEIVKAEAGILESDSAEVAVAKLEAAAPRGAERQWLVAASWSAGRGEAASPAERQELFTAWRRFLEGLAAARQSVLVFEDLHWADEALLAFLEHWPSGRRAFRCSCSARPGRSSRSGTRLGRPGPERDDDQPAAALGSGDGRAGLPSDHTTVLSAELSRRARAGGREPALCGGVRASARRPRPGCRRDGVAGESAGADRRPAGHAGPERKSLLQDAAVLGKVFWVGALAEIGGRDQARARSGPARAGP